MHEPSTSKNTERKERKVGAVSGKGGTAHLTKRQIQEISTDCVASTISAMITVDPRDQEEGPSANAGDSFGGKRNQIQHKIMKLKVAMSPLTSVFACPLGDDVPYDDSVRINLENQALLLSGWRRPSNSTTSC